MAGPQQVNRVENILADPDDESFSIEAWMSSGTSKPSHGIGRPVLGPMQSSIENRDGLESNGSAGRADHAPGQPAWTEMKTKAGKERKRLPLACIACRRKKIRCSGEKPACKHCLKSRIPCVYKVTAKKAAPRTDYMAMLDKRLKRMEDRVIKIIPKDESSKLPNLPRAVVKPAATQPAGKSPTKKRTADEAFSAEIEDWANSSRLLPRNDSEQASSTGLNIEAARENTLLTEGTEFLPAREIQDHLVEVFFEYLYGQSYYLLHKPSFMRKFAMGEIPAVLVLAMCAISARFSNHPTLQTEPAFLRGQLWADAAREIALRRFDSPNITILSVFLILGLHEFGTCQGGRSWMLGGMAHRMAYALQLHKDLDHDPQDSKTGSTSDLSVTDREIRRRTMWACFMMDRFNSSGTDRPMFASEQYMYLQLPVREDYFLLEMPGPTENIDGGVADTTPEVGQPPDLTANMGVAAYTLRLIALWGRMIQYMNLGGREKEGILMWAETSTHARLLREVDEFDKTLPDFLRYNEENLQAHAAQNVAAHFLYMHIAFHQCGLFINRYAYPSIAVTKITKDMPNQFLWKGRKAGLKAANAISDIIRQGKNHRLVVPFAGYCAYLSSAVHIHGVFSRDSALEASSKEQLASNIKYLSKVKKFWGMFHFLTESLKDLYRQHADAAAKGTSTPSNMAKHQRAWQYGDWFDQYPHGVSQTDYEVPRDKGKKEAGDDAVLSQKSDLQTVEDFFKANAESPSADGPKPKHPKRSRGVSSHPASARRGNGERRLSLEGDTPQQSAPPRTSQGFDLDMSNSPFGYPESYDRSQIQPPPTLAETQTTPELSGATMSTSPFDPYQFQPSQVSVLDNRLVQASLNGLDTTSQGMSNDWFDMGLGGFNNDYGSLERSSAWFMPFNINPSDFQGVNEPVALGQPVPGWSQDFWFSSVDQGVPKVDQHLSQDPSKG